MLVKSKLLTITLLALVAFSSSDIGAEPGSQRGSGRNQRTPRTVNAPPPSSSSNNSNPTSEEPEPDVVRVETNLVNTVFTAVDRDRHFVTTLRADDLRIYENDAPQTISLFERETDRPLMLVILVDTSKSQERTLPDEKKAAKAFIRAVVRPEKDKVAVISFTGVPRVKQQLTENVTKLNRAIDHLRVELPANNPNCDEAKPVQEDPLCWTSIWDSVWESASAVLGKGDVNSRRAVILLSDGDDTSSTIKRQDAIDAAVENNVAVYSIGIGDPELYKIEQDSLRKISDRTGGRAFFPRDEVELGRAFVQIQEELRSQYVIAYSPQNRSRDGSHRRIKMEIINPELRKQKLQLIYRQGYFAAKQ
ncbi:MAG: VWA domain-containing protein [Pyrinomonadaceae bacterium]|nr:VWA domain-containing protein [Pyrinomonadaceae bacterium]